MKAAKIILGVLLVVGFYVMLFDFLVPFAVIGFVLGLFLCVAIFLIRNPPRSLLLAAFGVLLVAPGSFIWRALPIHSLAWSGVDRIEIERIDGVGHFEVADSQELKQLEAFAARGTLRSMLKSGYGYKIIAWKGGIATTYFDHGDAIGNMPGGFIQTIFVPSEPGFMEWFEELLARHGHPRG